MVPGHLHATRVAVYLALFSFLDNYIMRNSNSNSASMPLLLLQRASEEMAIANFIVNKLVTIF